VLDRTPDCVSHLILCGAYDRQNDFAAWGGVNVDTYSALARSNWRMASLALIEIMLGSSFDAVSQQWYFRLLQESVTPEMAARMFKLWWDAGVRDLLHKVRVPTLVVHYRNDRAIPFEAGRELAVGIPGARLVPLEGDAHLFYFGDTRPLRRAIAEFLGDPIEELDQPSADSAKSPSAPKAAQCVFRKEGE
jgi:pimeloyl-ACP methyl ester carboxylesterase